MHSSSERATPPAAPDRDQVIARWRAHLAGCGEMGPAIAAHNWACGPLGPVEEWPATLRSAVGMCVSSRFPIALWWGPELVMIYNDAYRPVLGENKHPQALGAPGRTVWPEVWDVIGPMLNGVLAGHGATWSEDQLLHLNRNGFLEECYFTFSYSPILVESGVIRGVLCAVTETTERVIAARRLETLLALSGELSALGAPEDVAERAAAILESDAADIPGVAIHRMDVHPPQVTRAGGVKVDVDPANLERAARSPGGLLIEQGAAGDDPGKLLFATAVCEPGETQGRAVLTVALSPQLPFDAAYRFFVNTASVHLSAALTGSRRLEYERARVAAMAELDKAKSVFFADISHELRTPLTLIGAPLADVLADSEHELARAHRELIEIAQRNTTRLSTLVHGMLDFARIEADRLNPEPVAVDLSAATAALAANFAPAVEAAGLRFDVAIPSLPRPAYVDVEMWERVVLNLLSNAVKYTLTGSVQVRLRDAGAHAELVVSDTGVGIATEDLPRLFERFYRAGNTGGRSQEGCGIGLALVNELVKLFGGEIEVSSNLGVGSTFTVRLPYGEDIDAGDCLASTSPVAAEPYVREALTWRTPQTVVARPRPNRPRLLIAEDSADMRAYLRRMLAPEFDVLATGDGQSALRAARNQQPDLVLSDVMMPGLDGFGLLAAIRSDPATANLPVVLLSARAGEEAAAEGLAAGADDYIVKPFSGADLIARLRANLERARARSRDAAWRAAMLGSLSEGALIANASGVILDMNDAFERLTGYGREGLPYAPPYPWRPARSSGPGSEERPGSPMEQAVAGRRGRFEATVRHRSGRLVWVSATAATVPDPDGGPDLITATARDITRERTFQARRDAASVLASELVHQVDLTELQAAAVHGLSEVFEGAAILFRDEAGVSRDEPARMPDTFIDRTGTRSTTELAPALHETVVAALAEAEEPSTSGPMPGLLIRAAAPEEPHLVWIEFDSPRTVTTDERALAEMLGVMLATALDRAIREDGHLHTEDHLRRALEGQRTVAHAVGILIERHRITHQAAFDRLRKASNKRNVKLRDLAERLVETGVEP